MKMNIYALYLYIYEHTHTHTHTHRYLVSVHIFFHSSQTKYAALTVSTYDADTSRSCLSASSRFIDSNSTFSSMFYEEKTS